MKHVVVIGLQNAGVVCGNVLKGPVPEQEFVEVVFKWVGATVRCSGTIFVELITGKEEDVGVLLLCFADCFDVGMIDICLGPSADQHFVGFWGVEGALCIL